MLPNELADSQDLLLHLRFAVLQVQERLRAANLNQVALDTGISYSNLCRLRGGGVPSLPTLELLCYYFGPADKPTATEFQFARLFPVDSLSRPRHFSMNPPRGM